MLHRYSILMLTLLGAASCSEKNGTDEPFIPTGGKVEVVIGGTQTATRTSLEDDGRTVRWSVGDQIALWATADEGTNYVLSATPFTLRTYNSVYSSADFSSLLDTPMDEGTYTYYAAYPLPASAEGSMVTYTVPAVQKGYDGAYDIMVAQCSGDALDNYARDERVLSFRHLLHMIRIEIPQGRNHFGSGVRRLDIEFPVEVTGSVSFNIIDPENTLSFGNEGGSRILSIDFEEQELTDTEGLYAYAFIAPVQMDGEVTFRAYNANGTASKEIRTTISKTMAPGRVTPIALTIPEARPVTYLDFQIAVNNLGEALTDIHLTAPEACFVAPFSTEVSNQVTPLAVEGGIYRAAVYTDLFPVTQLEGQPLRIDYESENALLSNRTITLPGTIAENAYVEVPMTVPYLFEERFDGVLGFSLNPNENINPAAVGLDNYSLPGWTGARVESSANTAIRVSGRYYYKWGLFGSTHERYSGRLDSGPVSTLKPGKSVNIQCTFNIDGSRESGKNAGSPVCEVGWTTDTSATNGESGISNRIDSYTLGLSGSYTNVADSKTISIDGCTNAHRLSWKVSVDRSNASGTGGVTDKYHAYIDNICISIVQ